MSSYTKSKYTPKQMQLVREQMYHFEERPVDPNTVPIRRRGKAAPKTGPVKHRKHDMVWDAYDYDKETGLLRSSFWHLGVFGEFIRVVYPSPIVCSVSKLGYPYVTFKGVKYPVHRLAWRIVAGEWPTRRIRHLNGLRFDNRWENLALSIGKPTNGSKSPTNGTLG